MASALAGCYQPKNTSVNNERKGVTEHSGEHDGNESEHSGEYRDEKKKVNLKAETTGFTKWSAHPEVASNGHRSE